MFRTKIQIVSWVMFVVLFYLFYDSYFSFFLLIITFVLIAFLALSSKMVKKKVSYKLVTPTIMTKNDNNECYLEVKNDSFFPIAKVKCKLSMHNSLTGEVGTEVFYFSINGKSKERIYLNMESRFCGNIHFQLQQVNCYDFLGLFFTTDYPNISTNAIVLPAFFEIHMNAVNGSSKKQEFLLHYSDQVGVNSNEICRIKPYIPGDNVKNIHWKLSSKFDELIMKEMSEGVDASLLILLETSIFSLEKRNTPIVNDAMVEAFVSISRALIVNGETHSLGWFDFNSQAIRIEEIQSLTDLTNLLTEIMKIEMKKQDKTIVDLFFEQMAVGSFSHIFYIASQQSQSSIDKGIMEKLTMLSCEEVPNDKESTGSRNGVVFTPDTMKEELRQLIL